jgi:hypothetical protein
MIPLTVLMIINIHCYADPQEQMGDTWYSPAGRETRDFLVSEGIIKVHPFDGWVLTDKGEAYYNLLMKLPFPDMQVWVWSNDSVSGS